MKRLRLFFPILFLLASATFAGCTDEVSDTKRDDEVIIPDVSDGVPLLDSLTQAAGLFRTAQGCVIEVDKHKYQVQFNLHIDNFSGYLATPHNFESRLPSTYSISDEFQWGVTERFLHFCVQASPIIKSASSLGVPELGTLAEVMYALGSHIMVDSYGAFPYLHYKKMNQDRPVFYFKGEQIYDSIFVTLKESVRILEAFKLKPASEQQKLQEILNQHDCVSGANVDNWIKFINSLRLRLAMRMTKVDIARAQKEAEEAIAAGVLTEADNDFGFDYNQAGDKSHPLFQIARSWVDTRLNASFLNILQRLQCPLLEVWFDKNAGDKDKDGRFESKDGTVYESNFAYMGVRNGVTLKNKATSDCIYPKFSNVNSQMGFKNISWMKVSEVLFLRAEGALRGWNMGGSAQSLYEQAIAVGMKRELTGRNAQAKIDKYVALERAIDTIDYVDYYDQANNCKGVITIGVKWNEADSYDLKLEKIITQKYILNFPVGLEAWCDIRRTGYPKQFPVVFDGGDGSIIPGDIIRRLPFGEQTIEGKNDANTYGVQALGGLDQQGTRVWWDK